MESVSRTWEGLQAHQPDQSKLACLAPRKQCVSSSTRPPMHLLFILETSAPRTTGLAASTLGLLIQLFSLTLPASGCIEVNPAPRKNEGLSVLSSSVLTLLCHGGHIGGACACHGHALSTCPQGTQWRAPSCPSMSLICFLGSDPGLGESCGSSSPETPHLPPTV